MSGLFGLPDFGARQATDAFEIYAPYEPGPYLLLPNALGVGSTPSGTPDVAILLVRSSGTGSGYGRFDLGIERQQDIAGALAFLRGSHPDATVALAAFEAGFIRVVAGSDLSNVPADLLQPSPLGWGGLDATRWNLQLSSDAASILKSGLTNVLPLTVRAEVEVVGVAPRVACTAVFDPAALMKALVGASATSRQVPRTAIDDLFRQPLSDFPWLKLEGNQQPDREAFAIAMAGHVRMEYGRFVASPTAEGPSYVELADVPAGIVRWNLAQPYAIRRAWVFTLDPFSAARKLAAGAGISAVYREVTTAPLPLGFFNVDVQAFLPSPRVGAADVGMVIDMPANPPLQPQGESHTIVLQPPADQASLALRLPPFQKLAYARRTFADLVEGGHVRRLYGPTVNDTGATVWLQPGDLPIDLLEMSADPALLAMATLVGTLTYTAPGGATVVTAFSLDAAHPRAAAALPRDAASASVTVDAHASPPDGSAAVRLGPMPAAALHLTVGSFPQYGMQTVAIACTFDAAPAPPFGLDLRAEDQPDSAVSITTLFLSRDSPTAVWSYLAASPFHAGYRWRAHGSTAWSSVQAPGASLQVHAQGAPAAGPQVWDIADVHLYQLPGDPPERVRYVPARPTPQLDDHDRPTLMVVDTGSVAILSIGTRFDLTDEERNDLEVALLQQMPSVQRIDFQPAPFTVGPVSLTLADAGGAFHAVASTPSMGAPPYNATFSVQLRGDDRVRALVAVTGSAGILRVDYPVTLAPEVAKTYPDSAMSPVRSTDVASWFPDHTGAAHIQKVGV